MGPIWVLYGLTKTHVAHTKTRCIPDGPSHPEPTHMGPMHVGPMWVFVCENRTSNIGWAQLKTRCIPDGPSHQEPTSTNTYGPHMGPMWVFGGNNRTSKIVFTQLKTRCIPYGRPSHKEPTGIRSPRGPFKNQMYTRWAFPSRTHKYQHI